MEPTIFAYIRRYSWRQQLIVLAMTVAAFPFLYLSLDLPKIIINDALGGGPGPKNFLGFTMGQYNYLYALCAVFLALVLINQGFKYAINVYKGVLGERMLRRLRYTLYSRVLRFPQPHFKKVSQGELVQMVNAEVEPLGGFVGDSVAVPAFQGGTLLVILTFMFVQDPIMGLAAIFLYPLQVYIIPKLQRQVNDLGKRRVRQVRRIAERISETAQGVRDIRANDATIYERARFSDEVGKIFFIRLDIYKKKFLIKFLNNFISQLGPFFFYSVGGYLVLEGRLTIGALVAVIAAHKDLYSPWKELLSYYQFMSDARIKYEQVVNQFAPPGMIESRLQESDPEPGLVLGSPLRASGLSLEGEADELFLNGCSFETPLPKRVAVVGANGSGKDELLSVLANLIEPTRGAVYLGDAALADLPEAVTGRRIGYVDQTAQVFAGTIEDNLLFGLKHRPIAPPVLEGEAIEQHERARKEADASGGSPHDAAADWVDWGAIAPKAERGGEASRALLAEPLRIAKLDADVFQLGMRSTLDLERRGDFAGQLLEARKALAARMAEDRRLARLVETFDPDRYNTNASVAENIIFGLPRGSAFNLERMAETPFVVDVLEEVGLVEDFHRIGYQIATTMVEIFADLPADHEFFRQYSFIDPDDLADLRALIGRSDMHKLDRLSAEDRAKLMSLPFKLAPARHRLGLIDEPLQARLLEARRVFQEKLPRDLVDEVAFFDPDLYNNAASIQDNILFGKVAYGVANAGDKIRALIIETLDARGLRDGVIEAGLSVEVGVSGGRLSPAQRQKLALARTLMRRPEILILNDPLGALDTIEQKDVMEAVLEAWRGQTLIWGLKRAEWASSFDHVLAMADGRVAEAGTYAELDKEGGLLRRLEAA